MDRCWLIALALEPQTLNKYTEHTTCISMDLKMYKKYDKNVKLYYRAIIVSRADNSVKDRRNLPITLIPMRVSSLVKIPWHLLVNVWKRKYGRVSTDNCVKICPLAIPNQSVITLTHKPSLVKIHWCLLVNIRKRNTDGLTDGRTDKPTSNVKS